MALAVQPLHGMRRIANLRRWRQARGFARRGALQDERRLEVHGLEGLNSRTSVPRVSKPVEAQAVCGLSISARQLRSSSSILCEVDLALEDGLLHALAGGLAEFGDAA